MMRLGFVLTLAAGATAAQAAEYKWGAISLDLGALTQDSGYGLGGGDTEDEAKENAQKFCNEGGAKACRVVTTYQHCGAVAVGTTPTSANWGIGDTKEEAEQRAMHACTDNGCKVIATDCN